MDLGGILHEIETLLSEQRWRVLEHTRALLEAEIPNSFREAMAEIEQGETVELDDALTALER